ncbi:MAG: hypothetical protein HY319_17240 [Armatimonadetes bacterium]|nr:hypothetical protein [Armatimonadota bacterium]
MDLLSFHQFITKGGEETMLDRIFPFLLSRRRLSAEVLRTVQAVTEQVVLAVEQTFRMAGDKKKAMALQMSRDILAEVGVQVPDLILNTAIEASVRVMKLLERAVDAPSSRAA